MFLLEFVIRNLSFSDPGHIEEIVTDQYALGYAFRCAQPMIQLRQTVNNTRSKPIVLCLFLKGFAVTRGE